MPKLSDNQVGDRLEVLGTDEGETIRGNTASVAARQALTLLEQGLLIAAERKFKSPQHGDEPAHCPTV